jgi:hypothetical protein
VPLTAQQLQFELMRLATADDLDGDRIADELQAHADLWHGALIGRNDLIGLRDLRDGYWNADTLVVLSSGLDDDALEALARQWRADTVHWIEGDEAARLIGDYGTPTPRILMVWWD